MAGCTAHALNIDISTSGLKSDVVVVFLDPDLVYDAKIKADIGLFNICMDFQDLLA